MNRYKNPWAEMTNIRGKEFYENNAPLYCEHRGVQVYRLFDKAFDCVIDGMCVTQLAGFSKPTHLDALLDGERGCVQEVAEHLRANGFPAISYEEHGLKDLATR